MNRRQYKNPPISEAVCAVRFVPNADWDLTYPALFYAKVKSEYDGKTREQKLVNLEPSPKDVQQIGSQGMAVNEISRLQFVTKDERKIISLYQDDLAISVLRPYPGWEVFRPTIANAFDTYVSVVNPSGIRRIGFRYINQVQVNGGLDDLLRCFTSSPPPLPNASTKIQNFGSRVDYVFSDEPIKIAVTIARLIAPEEKSAALLDVDLTWEWLGEALSIENAMGRIDELRVRERGAFESLITDHARELFDV